MQVARIRCFRIVILQCFVPARFSPCFSWQILSCRRFCYGLPISWRTKTLFELSDGLISSIPDFILESPRSQNNVSAFFFKFNTEQKNSFENAEYTVMRRGILDRQNIFVEDFYKVQTMFSQRNNYRDFIRVCSSIASMIITSKINSANIISNVS